MTLAGILRRHWSEYVRDYGAGKIPAPHWRAVEAVLSCRTPRLGGHVHACTDCGEEQYVYHSCNHRACPRCGAREQQLWAARQQARRLPVPYCMVTFTVPQQLHRLFRRHERIAWNVNLRQVGRGKKAIRYLAAYVARSAFSEKRLAGYDEQGRIRLRYTDSNDGRSKVTALPPLEFIRRWLQHVLPKGLTRVRHYGYLSAAAVRAYRRLRFLLGGRPLPVLLPEPEPIRCPCCKQPMEQLRKILPARGPPLSAALLYSQ